MSSHSADGASARQLVVGAALVRHGRVLAARRTAPPVTAGRWELPGGKVEPGERPEDALVREVAEELGCTVRVIGRLGGEQPVGERHLLVVLRVALVEGEPTPHEHDAVRWLGPEQLDEVDWLEPDRPFLAELRELLLDGHRLDGGNVGGAVRVGGTVRRATGPWTPAVHRLLDHLGDVGLRAVPRVLGIDARGREVLDYLPGRVIDVDTEQLDDARLADLAAWARELHDAVASFDATGPWRFFGVERPTLVAHNDLAPYNVCFTGDRLTGVFDWDLAGPSTPLHELAHLAWTGVPLFRPVPTHEAARRLRLLAAGYGGPSASEILAAVPARVRVAVDGIRTAVAAGDEQMRNLTLVGEPERTERALAAFLDRLPELDRSLA
ncbi:MAG: NUDIX domain-containing protein [Nocardioidaceae bacterium]